MLTLEKGNLSVQVYKGNLVSLVKDNVEYMHGGGKPEGKTQKDMRGWQSSDNTMFPVVGPVQGYRVNIGERSFAMDKHGVTGLLPFYVQEQGEDYVRFIQEHDGRKIPNPQHDESRPGFLEWPAYRLEKKIELGDGVHVTYTITNESKEEMPYMLGGHPAWRFTGGVINAGREYSIEDIRNESDNTGAVLIEGLEKVVYKNMVVESDFGNFMLWSPDDVMFCTEPVTQLPVLDKTQDYFTGGGLKPGESKRHSYSIKFE